jgi:predicted metal-binding membrane protein
LLAVLLTALVLMAWCALWLWGGSPYGHLAMHGGHAMHMGGTPLLFGAVFVFGWLLMTVAMMLPTSMPLILLFQKIVRGRPRSSWLIAILIGGYLAVWTLFGVLAHFLNLAIRAGVRAVPSLADHPWILACSILGLAGLYQFSPLKYSCLDKCRSPMTFVVQHWGGGNETAQALRLGMSHGLFCVGCCWSLMLLMFAVGSGSLGWMLALGLVMAAEKNLPWGRRLSAPVGIVLLVSALVVGLTHA